MANTTKNDLTTTSRTGAVTRAGIVLAATVATALLKVIAGGHLRVDQGGTVTEVGLGPVIVSSVLAGLAGWALLAALERNVARPRLVWTIVAAVVAGLSLAGPLGAAVDAHSSGTLVGLHVAVAAVLIPAFAAVARPRAKRG